MTNVTASNVIQLNQWQYFAVTVDTAGNVTLYENGTVIATGTGQLPANITRTSNLIGESNWPSNGLYAGRMSDLSIWTTALSATQVSSAMNSVGTSSQANMVGLWRLTETGTAIANTSTSTGTGTFNGTLTSTATPAVLPPDTAALNFDGSTNSVALPSTGLSNFTNGFSAGVWVYPTAASNNARFFELGNGSSSDNIVLQRNGMSNDLTFYVFRGSSYVSVTASNAIGLNTWQYFSATVDASGNVKLYKNGTQLTTSGSANSSSWVPNNLTRSTNYIGKSSWSSTSLFQGQMSDLSIWNTALSASQVNSAMNTTYTSSQSNMVGLWRMNESSGTTLANTSTNSGTGTLNGTLTSTVLGTREAGALNFNGTSNYVSLPSTGLSNFTSGFSAGAWVYPTAASRDSRIFDFGNGLASDNILLCRNGTTNDLAFVVKQGSSGTSLTATGALELNKWQYFSVTVTNAGVATLYKNGIAIATSTNTNFVPSNVTRSMNTIGKSPSTNDALYQGQMSDLSIWNTALTQAQVNSAMATTYTTSQPNMVGLWRMTETSTAPIANTFTSTGNGVMNGTMVTSTGPGTEANAISFDGSTNYITLPSTGLSNFINGFSAGVWVYPTSNTGTQYLFTANAGTWANGNIIFQLNAGVLGYYVGNNSNSGGGVTTSSSVATLNQWQYFAVTQDASGYVTLYKNGDVVATGQPTFIAPINVTRTQNYLGGSAGGNLFTGKLSDFSIWNTALTAAQVKTGMSSVYTSSGSNLAAFWRLNEPTGTPLANDVIPNGTASGTLATSPTLSNTADSSALKFDGTNTYATLSPAGLSNFTTGFSAGVWAYPTAASNNARFFEFGNGSSSDNIVLQRNGTSNDLTFYVFKGSSYVSLTASNAIELNKWQYFSVTIDSSGNVKIYKNGTQIQATSSANSSYVPNNLTRSTNYIGNSSWSSVTLYQGQMSDLSIWNTALTQAQVTAGMTTRYTGTEANLVNYWQLNQAAGTINAVPGGYALANATMAGTFTAPGAQFTPYATGTIFDGSNTYITLPASSPSLSDFTNGFSAGLWVYPTAANNYARFFDFGNGAPSDNIVLCRSATSNDLLFQVNKGTSATALTASGAIELNKWQYFSVTVTSSGVATLYKNGVSIATSTNTGFVPNNLTRANNYIGKSPYSGDALYQGVMNDLSIWNTALSATQVSRMMTQNPTGAETGLVGNWPMDDGSFSFAYNVSSNPIDGTITGGVAASVNSGGTYAIPYTTALQFNTSSQNVSLGTTDFGDLSEGFSAGFWVYPTSFTQWGKYFDFNNAASQEIQLYNQDTAGGVTLVVTQAGVSTWVNVASVLELNKWQYIAVSMDSAGVTTFYKDGVNKGSGTMNVPVTAIRTSGSIGSGHTGKMSSLSIWNRPLTTTDISNATNSPLSGSEWGLVNYWPLNETSGTTITDLASSTADATICGSFMQIQANPDGSTTPSTSSPVNSSLSFNGSTNYVSLPSAGLSNFTTGFSAGVWVYPTSNTGTQYLFTANAGTWANGNIIFQLNAGVLGYYVGNNSGSGGGVATTSSVATLNQWQYFAVTQDTSGNVTLYKNGVVVATGQPTTIAPTNVTRTQNYLGGSSGGTNLFVGQMNSLSIWNTALTAGYVQYAMTHMVSNATDSGLVSYYPMNETAGTSINDISGTSGHAGTLAGTLASVSTAVLNVNSGPGMSFNGLYNYVQLPNTGLANFTTGFSAGMWVNPSAVQNNARFFDFGNGATSDNILLTRRGTTRDLMFQVYNGSTPQTLVAPGAIDLNKKQYFAVTVDTSGNVTIYKNGVSIATATGWTLPANVNRTLNYVGKSNTPKDDVFAGTMSNLTVWSVALTANQVKQYMGSAPAGTEASLVGSWPMNEASGSSVADQSANLLNGTFNGMIGDTKLPGIVIRNGKLLALNIDVKTEFGFSGMQFGKGLLTITYAAAHMDANGNRVPDRLVMNGYSNFSLLGSKLDIQIGGNGTDGLVVENGKIKSFDFSLHTNLAIFGVSFGTVDLTASYKNAIFVFAGTADITLSASSLPDWVKSFFPSKIHVGRAGFMIRLDTNHLNDSNSFAQFWMKVKGEQVGIKVDFAGTFTVTMGNALDGTMKELARDVTKAYYATAAALSDAYRQVSGGVVDAYNAAAVGFDTAVASIKNSIAQSAAAFDYASQALANGAKSVVGAIDHAAHSIGRAFRRLRRWGRHGNLQDATIFYDQNSVSINRSTGTLTFDANTYPNMTTRADGVVALDVPEGSTGGRLILFGGVDQSTGLANNLVLTAPMDSLNLNVFTTVMDNLFDASNGALTISEAQAAVVQALGLPSSVDFNTADYIQGTLSGQADMAAEFANEIKIVSLANMVQGVLFGKSMLDPSATKPDLAALSNLFFASLADAVKAAVDNNTTVDLSDPATISSLLNDTASRAGIDLTTEDGQAAALCAVPVMAAVNQYLDGQIFNGSTPAASYTYATAIVQAQTLAIGTLTPALGTVDANTDTASFVAQYTGENLAPLAQAVAIGNLTTPTVSITDSSGSAGVGQANQLGFTITVSGNSTLPIIVNYQTLDMSAVAGTDYTPITTGSLTWLPGDTAPKQIYVTINASAPFTINKNFEVVFGDISGAIPNKPIGIGTITSSTIASTVSLRASSSVTSARSPVTFTANVVNEDEAHDAGAGIVSFYDGTTLLGTSTLDETGIAELTVTDLGVGDHEITATYNGYQVAGGTVLTSSSEALTQTVNIANQSIAFTAIPDLAFGDSVTLEATSSSGLPVTYVVVSGPGTLADNVLTTTGPGTVVVQAVQAGDSLTNPTVAQQQVTVNPAILTVTVDNQLMTYGGTVPSLTYHVTGFVNSDTEASLSTPIVISAAADGTLAGAYMISASGATDDNYTIHYVGGTLTVAPVKLVVTAADATMVYGSSLPTLSYSYSGFINGDSEASLTALPTLGTAAAGSHVGTYAIQAAGAVDPNYTFTFVPGVLTITPAPLTIAVDNQTITYGDALPAFTLSYTGFVNGDDATSLTQQPTIGRDSASVGAGTYGLTASGAVDANYTINTTGGTLTINQATVVVTANDQTMVYGSPQPAFTASFSGFKNGDDASSLTQQPSFSTTSDGTLGTAAISASGALSANYMFSYSPGTLTITALATSTNLTASTVSPTVGDSVTFTAVVSGTLGSPLTAGTVQFKANGVNLGSPVALNSSGLATFSTSGLTAGAHSIQAVYTSGVDSILTSSQSMVLSVRGMATTVTLSQEQGTLVYGQGVSFQASVQGAVNIAGSTPTGTVQFAADGVNYGTAVSLDSSGAALSQLIGSLTAGQHTISASYSSDSVTFADSSSSLNVTVTKASQTITFGSLGTATSSVISLGGTTTSGLPVSYTVVSGPATVSGNTLTITGQGTVTVQATQAGDSNYLAATPVLSTVSVNITPTATALTSSAGTSVYGQSATLTATISATGATPTGTVQFQLAGQNYGAPVALVNGLASLSLPGTLNVGSYAFTAVYAGNANFLGSTPASLTQTINPAILTVSAASPTKTYDGTGATGFTTSISGFVNRQTLATSGVTGSASLSGAALTAVNAGSYAITPTLNTLAATNYTFVVISGTLTITPKVLTVSIVGTFTKVYDGTTTATLTAANYSLTGLVGSESLSVNKTTGSYATKNVGTGLTVSVSLAASDFTAGANTLASNYALPALATSTGAITARSLAVTFVGINKVYDGTTSVAPLTLADNRVAGDVMSASYTTASFSDKNAGYKTINVSGISLSGRDATNYTFNTTASNPANITQLALTATATGVNKVYDGTTTATVAYSLPGVINGDVVTLTGGTASFADKTAASGKAVAVTGLTLSGANAANYTVNATASTTANITQRSLTVTATGVNKVADGTTAATVALSDNRVAGDVITASYTAASFASASVASNVAISVTGITISGADAANYTSNTTASTTANISADVAAPAVVTQPAAQNVLPGTVASFSAAASGTPTTTTWQVSSNNGTTWTTATGTVSTTTTNGITTSTLSLTTALANNGQIYRAVFTNAAGSVTSGTANLTVAAATISSVGVQWGTKGTATLVTNADGLRLLPTGRTNDIPWLNINRITVTLSRAVTSLATSDIKLTSAVAGTTYNATSVTGSGTTWTITFANNLASAVGTGIINPDKVTVLISNTQLASYTRRLDVLPGDVNDDLAINSLDSAIVKNYYLVGIIPTQALSFLDTDGNGVIDVADYNLITARVGKKLP